VDFSRLETSVMTDEGFEARPYLDTTDTPTIGYGTTSILGEPVTLDAQTMTPTIARQLLRSDLYRALVDAQAVFSRFDAMGPVRQEVLCNMAYNLGRRRLAGFKKMIRAAEDLDYANMAHEMVDSNWYLQVGHRAVRLAGQMRAGTYG